MTTPTPTTGKAKSAISVSTSDLCEVLRIGERWLRQLADQGVVVKLKYGKWDLVKSVHGFWEYRRKSELASAPTMNGTAKQEFDRERARKLKLENDKREAMLVETTEAIAALEFVIGDVRTSLAGIPARVTTDLVKRRKMEEEIDAVLHQIADRLELVGGLLKEGRDPSEAYECMGAEK